MWESAYCVGWLDGGREGSNCSRGFKGWYDG